MLTYQVIKRIHVTPTNEHTETVLLHDPDPDLVDIPVQPSITRVLNHNRHNDGSVSYLVKLDDTTYRKKVPETHIQKTLIDSHNRQSHALTKNRRLCANEVAHTVKKNPFSCRNIAHRSPLHLSTDTTRRKQILTTRTRRRKLVVDIAQLDYR